MVLVKIVILELHFLFVNQTDKRDVPTDDAKERQVRKMECQ